MNKLKIEIQTQKINTCKKFKILKLKIKTFKINQIILFEKN